MKIKDRKTINFLTIITPVNYLLHRGRNESRAQAFRNETSTARLDVTYPSLKRASSVSPVRQVATASMKVVMPNEAWIGTRLALNAAVALSQHSKIKKLKKPTTN